MLLTPKDTPNYRYAMKELTDLVGMQVTGVILDKDSFDMQNYIGLQVTDMKTGECKIISFLSDEEGNGPGWYALDAVEKRFGGTVTAITHEWAEETKDIK